MTRPPFSFTAFSPRVPSAPVPERITATARATAFLRQRMQQEVERQARTMTRLRLRKVQGAIADGQIGCPAE